MNLIAVAKQGKLIEVSKGEGYLTTMKSCGISLVESKLMLNLVKVPVRFCGWEGVSGSSEVYHNIRRLFTLISELATLNNDFRTIPEKS